MPSPNTAASSISTTPVTEISHPHAFSAATVLTVLGSDAEHGLHEAEATARLAQFGPNSLPQPAPTPAWLRLLWQFNQPLLYILLAAGAITGALGEWVDAGVILGVVLINAIVGFMQEARAEDALRALQGLLAPAARVLREDRKTTLAAADLVPGDIVLLDAGDKVPADLRLLHAHEMQADESLLTGESLPVAKHAHVLAAEIALADRRNMAWAGSLITRGAGVGVVVATGLLTQTGHISALVAAAPELATPFTRKIGRMSQQLLWVILVLAALSFVIGTLRGQPAFEMFMAAVAIAVGAIPEGLPAAVTVLLAIGVKRMASNRAIVRRMPAVETLGGVTVICSDKTGTLTQNQMTVTRIHAGGRNYALSGVGYAPEGALFEADETTPVTLTPALIETLRAGLLCNDAALHQGTDGDWQGNGDPTEIALLTAAYKAGLGADQHGGHPRLSALPFESGRQYMVTHHLRGDAHLLYVKGAPERILERCDAALDHDGRERPLDREAMLTLAAQLAGQGLRVLALARKGHRDEVVSHAHVSSGLVFLGLMAMIDPPRPEAIYAVAQCRRAGIGVKMITGDHVQTATHIAAQLGVEADTALDGQALARMDSVAFARAALACSVFARVDPEQKLRLVQALQAAGHVVAMTGDGVNDAPALKAADIGVAMGKNGTEAARQAAAMVLTDDNFATLVAAVEQGRGVFDNLRRFLVWTLPTNFAEGLVLVLAIVVGSALPITPLQILWVNMATAILLGMTLAFEPISPRVMHRPPRNPMQALLDRELVIVVITLGSLMVLGAFLLFHWRLAQSADLDAARTLAANLFVLVETGFLFLCRNLDGHWPPLRANPWLWLGVFAMLLAQALFTWLPGMQAIFATRALNLTDGLWLLLTTALILGITAVVQRRLR